MITDLTDRILRQGRALVRAIEALGTIEPTGPFERALARLLIAAYKRHLRAIVGVAPAWMSGSVTGHLMGFTCRPNTARNAGQDGECGLTLGI
jgi:hypothetical protein